MPALRNVAPAIVIDPAPSDVSPSPDTSTPPLIVVAPLYVFVPASVTMPGPVLVKPLDPMIGRAMIWLVGRNVGVAASDCSTLIVAGPASVIVLVGTDGESV